jgi:hypothetical protein
MDLLDSIFRFLNFENESEFEKRKEFARPYTLGVVYKLSFSKIFSEGELCAIEMMIERMQKYLNIYEIEDYQSN